MKKADEKSYLNRETLRGLYPQLPKETAERLRLQQLYMNSKEEPKVKKKLSLALVLSLAALMIAAVAIAEVTTGILSQHFKSNSIDLTEEAENIFEQTGPVLIHEFEDITFTIREMASDGRNLFVAAHVAPKSGKNIALIDDGSGGDPSDPYSSYYANCWDAVKETGKRVVTAGVSFKEKIRAIHMSVGTNDDGSLDIVTTYRINEEEAALDELGLVLSLSGYAYEDEHPTFDYRSVLREVPLEKYPMQVKEIEILQNIGDKGIYLGMLNLHLTPISLYYDIDFHMPPILYSEVYSSTGTYMLDEDVLLHMFDESGQELTEGYEYPQGDQIRGLQTGSFDLREFPKEIFIKAYDHRDGSFSEAIRVEIP